MGGTWVTGAGSCQGERGSWVSGSLQGPTCGCKNQPGVGVSQLWGLQ